MWFSNKHSQNPPNSLNTAHENVIVFDESNQIINNLSMVEGNHNLEKKQKSSFQFKFSLIALGKLNSLFLCKENKLQKKKKSNRPEPLTMSMSAWTQPELNMYSLNGKDL